jgi:pyruvate/2-oxoacid:ferredoxin oxidoreductase beta subunit/Pyruvate/2-oxoacid:ferredoxin oxidoreductase gamma subunit/NAD-dependent dihydropyrimidine dehydrogenase PreA subunit
MATVASDLFGLYAQAYPKYGSEKKGLPTNYYLTLAPEPIRLHCELNHVEFVAIQDANAFLSGDPLKGLVEGGIVYLQSPKTGDDLWSSLPERAQATIREKKLRVFALDALKIARESASRADLQIRMQGIVLMGAFLHLTPFRERAGLTDEQLFASLEKALTKYFGKRGGRVVADNLQAARRGYTEVREIVPPAADVSHEKKNGARKPTRPAPLGDGEFVQKQFCDIVIGGYAKGREDELPADEFVARSLMPPSSAIRRSFRTLAAEIPVFTASACVGCMECVNQCPDTAILAKVAEQEVLDKSLARVERPELRDALRAHFAKTAKYHDLFVKKGEPGGMFGIFVDPDKCKGCGECITACGTHAALAMKPKAELAMNEYDLGMDLFHHLPETPKRYINEKALADMMLAGDSLLFAGGAGSCMGCGEATAVRLMLSATGFQYSADNIGIVAATGCNSVFGSTYPYNPYGVPWTNSLFENAPADAMGIRLRWNQDGQGHRRLWVLGGDGAMYDIGFQSLSRMLMSGLDIKVLVLDTQVYSNTGGQTSTSTMTGQDAKMAAFGKAEPGKRERRKELGQILMMHPEVLVAQTSAAHLNHYLKCIIAANEYPGPAVIIAYAACQPEHGIPDDQAVTHAKLAVESRSFPIFLYDPRKGEKISERLSLQGNPAMKEDWAKDKNGEPLDLVAFARTEGRFARHFDAEGNADEFLKRAQAERLENWHRLQELAGLR